MALAEALFPHKEFPRLERGYVAPLEPMSRPACAVVGSKPPRCHVSQSQGPALGFRVCRWVCRECGESEPVVLFLLLFLTGGPAESNRGQRRATDQAEGTRQLLQQMDPMANKGTVESEGRGLSKFWRRYEYCSYERMQSWLCLSLAQRLRLVLAAQVILHSLEQWVPLFCG